MARQKLSEVEIYFIKVSPDSSCIGIRVLFLLTVWQDFSSHGYSTLCWVCFYFSFPELLNSLACWSKSHPIMHWLPSIFLLPVWQDFSSRVFGSFCRVFLFFSSLELFTFSSLQVNWNDLIQRPRRSIWGRLLYADTWLLSFIVSLLSHSCSSSANRMHHFVRNITSDSDGAMFEYVRHQHNFI